MARSAFVEVNITNPTRLAQDSQDTANKAVKGVTDLNDPNLMSVIEKQNNIAQFAGLTSQLNVLVQNAKDEGIDTAAVITAYNNLNTFMADILADPNHASDIDRARYKKYQDAYNEELAKLQNALQNNTNDKFTSAASALSQAASTANVAKSAADSTYAYANSEIAVQSTATAKAQSAADGAFSQAQVVGSQADSAIAVQSTATAKAQSAADNAFSQAQAVGSQASAEIAVQSTATAKAQSKADDAFSKAQAVGKQASEEIAVQSTATAKAQSTADNAFSQATTAIDNGKVTSQAVTDLKDGSKLTIAELENGLATKVANSDYASYKEQTASQIGQLVTNGAFSAYQTQTADLIAQKVATSDFSTYQATTAKAIESKVESKDFNTYKTQTADLIDDKVSSSQYSSDKIQTASEIADRVSNSAFSTYQTQTASQIASKVDNGDFSTYKTQTADLIASKVANKDFSAYQATTAKSIESKVESNDFNTYKSQTDKSISSKVSTTDFNNLTISNRNLALGTATALIMTGNNTANQGGIIYKTSKTIPKGTTITTSFGISSTNTTGTFTVHFYGANDGNWQLVTVNVQNPLTTDVKHYSCTFVTTADHSDGIQLRLDNATGTVTMSNFIVSESSKEVSWTPAPEDQATQSQIMQLSGEIEQKVNSGDFSTYKTQTANLIAEKVANSDFSTYKKQTADLISEKVATKDFSAYQATTAKAIESKVESKDFNTYKSQTADTIAEKVATKDFTAYQETTAKAINSKVESKDFNTYKTQTDGLIAEKVANKDFSTYQKQTADLISAKVETKDFSSYKDETAKSIDSMVKSKDFNTYKTQTADAISSKVESSDFQTLQTQVDNSVVGTNLLPGTSGTLQTVTNAYSYNNNLPSITPVVSTVDSDTTYTARAWITPASHDMCIQVAWKDSSGAAHYNGGNTISAGTSGYSTWTGTLKAGSTIKYVTIVFTTPQSTASTVSYKEMKFEKGSVATDWSLNPEDQATQSQITQLSGDINLRVTKGDLISQINIQARNTLISSGGQLTLSGKNILLDSNDPVIMKSANIDRILVDKQLKAADIEANTFSTNNGTFIVDKNGSVTAKNMTLTGGTLTSPTINASKINSATINGTTINAGDIINNANNTSHFYPTTISNNGHIYTVQFNSSDAMQTDLSTGSLTTKYRAVNSTGTQYEAYDTMVQANQIALFAGHTNGKDMSFTQSVTGSNQNGYMLLSPLNGITLHGDTQQITFNGTSDDVTPKGIFITPYGNINPNGTQNVWYVGNGPAMKTASFGINADQSVPISLFRQTLVDEIGALGNRLSMGRLFLHAVDNDAQMYLLNDGKPAFVSPTIYNRTYSNGANMFVTSSGRVGRSTSASKYKLAIARSDNTSQADRLMTLNLASWNDKVATEKMAESLSNGEIPVEPEINLKRHYGLIAEDLRDAGLDEFLITGKDGQIEGIEYDRLWTVLIPKIKQLNNRINELERKTL